MFFFGNFFSSIAFTLLTPMILASSGGQSAVLGSVQSTGAIGGLLGGIALTAWGGPKKKINGVLIGWIVSGIGLFMMGLGRSLPFWLGANLLMMVVLPIVNGSNQAIWQAKTAPEVQGRVFSVRRLVAQITAPLSMAIAGPLADKIFEPAMTNPNTWLSKVLGPVFGSTAGSGMSIVIAISGILVIIVGLGAYRNRLIVHVEELIPDHDES